MPIFPEIMRLLLDCAEQATVGAEWVIENRCPAYIKCKPDRSGNLHAANLTTTFDKICKRAGLPIVPMIGNNMRASCEKDLYSGKYPELRGRVDLIGQILGHSPQIALQYYQRFSTDDFAPLVASFGNVAEANSGVNSESRCVKKCVKQGEKRAHVAHRVTCSNAKAPCFVASATLENTGRNAFSLGVLPSSCNALNSRGLVTPSSAVCEVVCEVLPPSLDPRLRAILAHWDSLPEPLRELLFRQFSEAIVLQSVTQEPSHPF